MIEDMYKLICATEEPVEEDIDPALVDEDEDEDDDESEDDDEVELDEDGNPVED